MYRQKTNPNEWVKFIRNSAVEAFHTQFSFNKPHNTLETYNMLCSFEANVREAEGFRIEGSDDFLDILYGQLDATFPVAEKPGSIGRIEALGPHFMDVFRTVEMGLQRIIKSNSEPSREL